MKIIVLAGGLSTERDVSLSSAAGICRTLVEKGHDAFLLDVFMGLENAPENLEDVFTLPDHGLEIVKNISTEEPDLEAIKASRPDQSDCFFGPNVIELCRLADITFLGLHGGEGENGKLQASFDLLGIKYTGPDSLGCAVAMHKGVAKQIFLESGVDTPGGGTIYKNSKDQSYQPLGLTLPVVVKPCSGGSSIGVYIVNTDEEYAEALKKSFRYEDELVVEPYIKGREFACGIIDGTALPPIEIIPKTGFFDYANKYQDGATSEVCPADIPEEVAKKAKYMVVSLPSNPVGSIATPGLYEEIIAFAKKYDILIIHDNAYSDIIFDGAHGGSFLATEGAKEIGVEFFSLSKSFNVTGARISFLVGRPDVIAALRKLRSQIDFGMFLPIQKAAIAALNGPLESVQEQCRMYQERRDALCNGLREIGWDLPNGKGTMFVWARIPGGRTDSMAFCMELMEKAGVIVTPGASFGPHGEGYVRFALVLPPEKIREVVEAIRKSGI